MAGRKNTCLLPTFNLNYTLFSPTPDLKDGAEPIIGPYLSSMTKPNKDGERSYTASLMGITDDMISEAKAAMENIG